jgi:hypothetical protein
VAPSACALHAKPTHAHAHRHAHYRRGPLRCRDVKRFLSATDRFGHVTWGPRWACRAVPSHGPCRASEGRPRRATELHAPGSRAGRPRHCPLALARARLSWRAVQRTHSTSCVGLVYGGSWRVCAVPVCPGPRQPRTASRCRCVFSPPPPRWSCVRRPAPCAPAPCCWRRPPPPLSRRGRRRRA